MERCRLRGIRSRGWIRSLLDTWECRQHTKEERHHERMLAEHEGPLRFVTGLPTSSFAIPLAAVAGFLI